MSVSVKNQKSTFKTLDTTVRTLDINGHPIDDGSNIVDVVNNEMAAAIGVSKAILNNVIFCHQEDSA
jgi:DNA repair protein RAD50